MQLLTLAAAAAVACACLSAPATAPSDQPPPIDPMAEKVATTCVGCHELTIITASHFDSAKWSETVDQMVSKGAQVSDEDYDPLVAYLTATYGPATPSP
jgi:Spy/CpxP family protein refolding chaperone